MVYRAHRRDADGIVALKVLAAGVLAGPEELRRFQREAEALAALDHPNIVPILNVGEHDGRRYFSMPMIAGGSLAGHLEGYRSDLRAAVRLVIAVARAVQHAHQRGILHRDLKPANILVNDRGEPQVTDFGLAKWVNDATELTPSGAIVGSPPYMAPEQASGSRHAITTLSDVYGLGSILYTLMTGRTPFQGDSMAQVVHRVIHEAPVPPSRYNPRIGRALEAVCLTCLDKEPRRRYSSASALVDDLERWVRGRPIQARPVGPLSRWGHWCFRHPAQLGLVGWMVVSILVGIGVSMWQWVRTAHQSEVVRRVQRLLLRAHPRIARSRRVACQARRHARRDPRPRRPADRRPGLGLPRGRCERTMDHRNGPAADGRVRESRASAPRRAPIVSCDCTAHGISASSVRGRGSLWPSPRWDGSTRRDGSPGRSTRRIGHSRARTIPRPGAALLTLACWQQAVGRTREAEANVRKAIGEVEAGGPADGSIARRARELLVSVLRSRGGDGVAGIRDMAEITPQTGMRGHE